MTAKAARIPVGPRGAASGVLRRGRPSRLRRRLRRGSPKRAAREKAAGGPAPVRL